MSLSKPTDTLIKKNHYPTPYELPEYFQVRAQLGSNVKILGEEVKFRTEKTGVIIPYSVLSGLALLNAQGEAIPTAAIYEFIIEYFPNCGNHLSNSCKSSIRNALCKYEFVEKVKDGRGEGCDWAIAKPKMHKFIRILKLFENRHPHPSEYGLKNIADWPLIRAGLKGLPSKERKDSSSAEDYKVPDAASSLLLPPVLTAEIPQDTASDPGSPPSLDVETSPDSSPSSLPFSVDYITHFKSPKLDGCNNELSPQVTPQKVPSPVKAPSPAKAPLLVKVPSPVKIPSPMKARSPVKRSPPRKSPPRESKPSVSSLNGFSANMPFYPFGAPMGTDPKLSAMQSLLSASFPPLNLINPMMMPPSIASMASLPPRTADVYKKYLRVQVDLMEELYPVASS